MRGFITLRRPRILGARVHVHWSALVVAGIGFGALIRQPAHAILAVLSYFGIIVLHEAGHAYFARQLGHRPLNIYLTFVHGRCEYENPDSLKEEATIAWGGVLAQFLVAVPLIALAQATPLGSISYFGIVAAVLGYISVLIALFNLAPTHGLDGAVAWRLIPIIVREIRERNAAKKAAEEVIRRVK